MSRVSTYLNFMGDTEESFNFYREVFAAEFVYPIQRFVDVPTTPGMPPLSDEERAKVQHVEMMILAGCLIMGTDMIETMGHHCALATTRRSTSSPTAVRRPTGSTAPCRKGAARRPE